MKKIITILALLIGYFSALNGSILDYKQYDFDGNKEGDTLLVLGGIHGNEPGGYYAPSLLSQHYKITKGHLVVIPNINFDSIIRNARGIYKDMNRKFDKISPKDPDYKTVTKLKKLITQDNIDLVLNLHDGHGFYRKKWKNTIFNPRAWGQALIIDQIKIKAPKYANLDEICSSVTNSINENVFNHKHIFDVKNTETKFKDEQMRLSLTYFAITHNKPALAIETSKNIHDTPTKVYYQLLTIEQFMRYMGIEFERDFELTKKNISKILKQYGTVTINNRMRVDLTKIKPYTKYVPLKKRGNKFVFSDSLGAVLKKRKQYHLMVGNKQIATMKGDYFKLSPKKDYKITMLLDGKKIDATDKFEVSAKKSFKIITSKGIRTNVIGWSKRGTKNESNIKIDFDKIQSRFTIYKNCCVYRIEFYDEKNRYIKTILIRKD
jgi:hypothetical protein